MSMTVLTPDWGKSSETLGKTVGLFLGSNGKKQIFCGLPRAEAGLWCKGSGCPSCLCMHDRFLRGLIMRYDADASENYAEADSAGRIALVGLTQVSQARG